MGEGGCGGRVSFYFRLATPSVSPSTWLRLKQVERNMAAGGAAAAPLEGEGEGRGQRSRRVDSAGGLRYLGEGKVHLYVHSRH